MYSISEEWPDFDHEHMRDSNLFTHRKFWNLRESEVDYLPLSFSREDTGELIAFFCFAQWNNEWKAPYLAPYFYPFSAVMQIMHFCGAIFDKFALNLVLN